MAQKKEDNDPNACQATGGTDEQQNPNRTPGMAAQAAEMLAADEKKAATDEARGDFEDEA